MSFPSNTQLSLDLSLGPNNRPAIWRPTFLSQNGHVSVNDSILVDGVTATTVAMNLVLPRDESWMGTRSDTDAINDALALSIRATACVTSLSKRLQARNNEVQRLNSKVSTFQHMLVNSRALVRELRYENKELKKLVDNYAKDLEVKVAQLESKSNEINKMHKRIMDESKKRSVPPRSST